MGERGFTLGSVTDERELGQPLVIAGAGVRRFS
jgi:hypothetical protein